MRILLVGNYALDNQASMLRYADMLSGHMSGLGHATEVIQPQAIFGRLSRQPMVRKWLGYIDKYVIFPMKLRARARRFDLVHVCDHSNSMYLAYSGGRPSSITCHDLLAVGAAQGRYPEQRVSFSGKMQQRWILSGLLSAQNVVCVSANTARELAALRGNAAQRVVVIANAISPGCVRATDENAARLRAKLGIAEDEGFLLHIGGNQWYKNRLGTLRIFAELVGLGGAAGRLKLVMAGAEFTREMRELVSAKLPAGKVIELVDPADEELWRLYTGATALLFPSLYEGFGWPPIEAQRCGCPVITSDRLPMTEVAGAAAVYIDPADAAGAAATIAVNLSRLGALREEGFRNARRFDAEVVFREYENFFQAAARARRSTDSSGDAGEAGMHREP